jgi:glyoxylase-like metal-dependent hydrolase (beta-lactamase superfamily II)
MSEPGWDGMTNRREFLAAASLACMGTFTRDVPAFGQAQQPAATAFKELRGGVGIFTGRGGTIGWYVSKEAVAVVDTMFPDMAKICLNGLNERSGNLRIDCVMITHHHGDHTAGAGVFKPAARRILAHEKVPELQKMAAVQAKNEDQQTYPDSTFGKIWVEELGKERAQLEHFGPAHTGGDAVIFFEKANIAHMGDLVFNRRHPFIDRPGGASISGWIKVLEAAAKKFSKDTLFIYGHAQTGFEVTGRTPDLLYQRDYFTALLAYMRAEIKSGKSRDAIVTSTEPLKGFADHGAMVRRVLEAAYDELAAQGRG